MEDNLFKQYLHEKRYSECILLLKNKITDFVVSKIEEVDDTFEYTTVSNLITASDFYIKDSIIAKQLEIALSHPDQLEQLKYLLSICETHNIR